MYNIHLFELVTIPIYKHETKRNTVKRVAKIIISCLFTIYIATSNVCSSRKLEYLPEHLADEDKGLSIPTYLPGNSAGPKIAETLYKPRMYTLHEIPEMRGFNTPEK